MAEIYPRRASGEWAGTFCTVKRCPKYARFVVSPYGRIDGRTGACGLHLAPVARAVHIRTGLPAIVQEVPGNWRKEAIVIDGEMRDLPPSERKAVQAEKP
jgi:hypothetical protein